jgi:hypothetical protein
MGGKSNDFNPVIGVKNCLGECPEKPKNRWGKKL